MRIVELELDGGGLLVLHPWLTVVATSGSVAQTRLVESLFALARGVVPETAPGVGWPRWIDRAAGRRAELQDAVRSIEQTVATWWQRIETSRAEADAALPSPDELAAAIEVLSAARSVRRRCRWSSSRVTTAPRNGRNVSVTIVRRSSAAFAKRDADGT